MKTNDKTTKGATKNNSNNGDDKGSCVRLARAHQMLALLAPSEVVLINVDVTDVVQTAYSVVPVMRALRARVTELLPGTNMERYDAFEAVVGALGAAHAEYMVASNAGDGLAEMLSEGLEMRAVLDAECVPMVKRGQLTQEQVRASSLGQGYAGVGFDLQAKQGMLRAIWPSIKDRSGVTIELLDRAKEFGEALVRGRSGREKREALLAEKTTERQKWFSLLVREYREVQRVVTYLRWSEGDADALAPSLWAKLGGTRRKKEEGESKNPAENGAAIGAAKPVSEGAAKPVSEGAVKPSIEGAAKGAGEDRAPAAGSTEKSKSAEGAKR